MVSNSENNKQDEFTNNMALNILKPPKEKKNMHL